MLIEVIGWLGSALFAACGFPQALRSYKDGHSNGLSWGFLLMWFFGEVLTLVYVAQKPDVLPLLVNYLANLFFLLIIIRYKIWARSTGGLGR